MSVSDLLTRPARPKSADDADEEDEFIAPGGAYACVIGLRQALALKFLRIRAPSFIVPYTYAPVAWWDSPERLLLEYPGLFTVALHGTRLEELENRVAERRVLRIRECGPDEATALPVAVTRIDLLRLYPSHDEGLL